MEAQNLELAQQNAQLVQFVSYKASSKKNAGSDFGAWRARGGKPQKEQKEKEQQEGMEGGGQAGGPPQEAQK